MTDAFAALVADRPQLQSFANRFAGADGAQRRHPGWQRRQRLAIGDSMPLLIALRASIVLRTCALATGIGADAAGVPLPGYRQNVMAPDEVLAGIKVPLPEEEARGGRTCSLAPLGRGRGGGPARGQEFLRAYKISKRYDDDISPSAWSSTCVRRRQGCKVSMGAGGVAATPDPRRPKPKPSCAARRGRRDRARRHATLRDEFTPLSDMRASSAAAAKCWATGCSASAGEPGRQRSTW